MHKFNAFCIITISNIKYKSAEKPHQHLSIAEKLMTAACADYASPSDKLAPSIQLQCRK